MADCLPVYKFNTVCFIVPAIMYGHINLIILSTFVYHGTVYVSVALARYYVDIII